MYRAVKVHVPEKFHEKLKSLIVKDQGIPVKVNLQEGDDLLLLTPGCKMQGVKEKRQ